jgi:hypothetical protein
MTGCLFMPFRVIGRLLKWCVTAGWKGFVVLALIFVLLGVGYCQCQQKVDTNSNTETRDTVPSIGEARYEVQTVHRLFYAKKVTKRGHQEVILQQYWEQVGGSWRYFNRLELSYKEYGEILIKKR